MPQIVMRMATLWSFLPYPELEQGLTDRLSHSINFSLMSLVALDSTLLNPLADAISQLLRDALIVCELCNFPTAAPAQCPRVRAFRELGGYVSARAARAAREAAPGAETEAEAEAETEAEAVDCSADLWMPSQAHLSRCQVGAMRILLRLSKLDSEGFIAPCTAPHSAMRVWQVACLQLGSQKLSTAARSCALKLLREQFRLPVASGRAQQQALLAIMVSCERYFARLAADPADEGLVVELHKGLRCLLAVPGYDITGCLPAAAPCLLRMVSRISSPPGGSGHFGAALRALQSTLMWCLQVTLAACPLSAVRCCEALLHLKSSVELTSEVASCLTVALASDGCAREAFGCLLASASPATFAKVSNHRRHLSCPLPQPRSSHLVE